MGLISRVSSRTYRKTNEQTCLPTLERPEKCEAKSATVTVELVNTESTQVDEVWLVVNITTESTSTNTIQVTLVKSVCDTSTWKRTSTSAQPSTSITCGVSLAKTSERNTLANPKPQSLIAPPTTSTKCSPKVNCQTNQSSSKPDSSVNKPKKKSRPPVVSAFLPLKFLSLFETSQSF